jgi:hypothetical protein
MLSTPAWHFAPVAYSIEMSSRGDPEQFVEHRLLSCLRQWFVRPSRLPLIHHKNLAKT